MTNQPQRLRASHDDRAGVTGRLAEAYAEGRLTREEFDERSTRVETSRYLDELDVLVADVGGMAATRSSLPATVTGSAEVSRITPGVSGTAASVAVFGGVDRMGTWTIAPRHQAIAVFGGTHLDLRDASFAADVVEITCWAVFGGIDIVVAPDARVEVNGVPIFGGFSDHHKNAVAPGGQTGPLIRVRGLAAFGGVDVLRKPLDED